MPRNGEFGPFSVLESQQHLSGEVAVELVDKVEIPRHRSVNAHKPPRTPVALQVREGTIDDVVNR